MTESKPLFLPGSILDIVSRRITPFVRLETNGQSIHGLQLLAEALTHQGAILLDAHIKRGIARIPQMADIGVSILHVYQNVQLRKIHLAAAGDFYHHPLVRSWITRYPPEGDQLLKMYDVYSTRREMTQDSRCANKLSHEQMESKNSLYHCEMVQALRSPGNLIVLNPFAGLNKVGEGSVPRRVATMLQRQVPTLLSATWFSPRGYVTGFNESLMYFDASDSSNAIAHVLNSQFSVILDRIRS